jgi:hypothetical protein
LLSTSSRGELKPLAFEADRVPYLFGWTRGVRDGI